MANKNRFTELMGSAGDDGQPVRKPVKKPASKKASVGKSADSNYDKVTLYIRSDIAHALRSVATFEKAEMSQLVEDAIYEKLSKSEIGKAAMKAVKLDS